METPEYLKHCETETIPGKSFVTRPQYPKPCGCGPETRCAKCEPPANLVGGSVAPDYPLYAPPTGMDHSERAYSTRPLTYLACPYSDPNPDVMEWRYEQATKAAAWLISKHELNVFSPITHSHPLHKLGGCQGDWKFWEKIDREYLDVSNSLMVLYLDNWFSSVGVAAEMALAREMDLKVEFLIPLHDGDYLITREPALDGVPMKMPIAQEKTYWRPTGAASLMSDKMRTFDTGATRNTDTNKPDYEGFLSPLALEEFGKYMLSHQIQADGSRRDSDNWQKGIPRDAYMKSLWRHLMSVWMLHRNYPVPNDEQNRPVTLRTALSAILFNAQGYLHEICKEEL